MLKRQRSTPSFVPDAYFPQEPTIDTFEREAKRRRQFAPPQLHTTDKGKGPWRSGDSDGEEDVDVDERAAGRLAPSEYAQRLENAGEYKHVNSLLHDLHAEQRHRMLFTSTSPPTQVRLDARPQPDLDHHFPCVPNKFAPAPGPLPAAPQEAHRNTPSFTISIPSKDASVVDHVEVRRVTQQYEDTNRFLGALFLNRRRQYDGDGTQTQT